jgi:hypothetical protein
MTKLTVTIHSATKGIVVDEAGNEYEVDTSFHARRLNGEYKYHEIYVFLNKLEQFKNEFKAPKTLRQKWFYDNETGKFKSLVNEGVRVKGYTETIGRACRAGFDLDEIEYDF